MRLQSRFARASAAFHLPSSILLHSHHSLLDYLHRQGFMNAYEALRVDADLPDFSPASANAKIQGLLEKKWTGTVRLQKKVSGAGMA